jgi:hypothetical protein
MTWILLDVIHLGAIKLGQVLLNNRSKVEELVKKFFNKFFAHNFNNKASG